VVTVLAIVYLAGVLGSVVVQRRRAGLTQMGRLPMDTVFLSLPWFMASVAKMLMWPIVLGVWFAQGRPASPWESTESSSGTLRVQRAGRAERTLSHGE
jgi:hypothetical protein